MSSPSATPSGAVVRRVPARVGLVGNPSDGFGGAVLAVPADVGAATVRVEPWDGVEIIGPVRTTRDGAAVRRWPSVDVFRADHVAAGHVARDRIITAALETWLAATYANTSAVDGFRVEWGSDVPESVGLAGSSALAVATIDAVSRCAGRPLPPDAVAALALAAEVDGLGIAAGWQDRVVQARDVPVLVDAARMVEVAGHVVPHVREVTPGSPFHLVVGWRRSAGESSDRYHRALRAAAVDRERDAAMAELAELARSAADAFESGDAVALGELVRRGWVVRQRAMPLRDDHARLVDSVGQLGIAATTPGSGGSVVAVTDDPASAAAVVVRLRRAGADASAVALQPTDF